MTKIYVCERGNVYEGGRVFCATTSLTKAWLAVRAIRLESTQSHLNSHVFNFPFSKAEMQPLGKNYWSDGYDYICIRAFED